jgi:hypothetical protein
VVALYLIVWGFALFTFFIFTCKINAVFAAIFLLVSVAAWLLSGAYWKLSWGDYAAAGKLQQVRRHCMFSSALPLTLCITGRGSVVVRCCGARMVHVLHHHGRRDAHHPQPPGWRLESSVAQDRC